MDREQALKELLEARSDRGEAARLKIVRELRRSTPIESITD
jgi:hypothetical protein